MSSNADGSHRPGARTILNARELENNVIRKDDYAKTVIPIFEDIIKELLLHSGPQAAYGLLLNPSDRTSDSVFTCDGINIVRSINYINPVSEAVRKLIAHIGKKIDRLSYDGTTSSMIIALKAIVVMMESDTIQNTPYSVLVQRYNKFVELVEDHIELNETWTIDDIVEEYGCDRDDAIRHIAYSQAYTSSHGDRDLSEAVAEVFVNNQQNNFKTIIIDRHRIEKPEPWYVVQSESQFETMDAVVIDARMHNRELQTALEHEVCTLMVHHTEISDNDTSAAKIFEAVKRVNETPEEKLVVIVGGMSGGFRASVVETVSQLDLFDRIAVCIKSPPHHPEEVNELLVLRNLVETPTAPMSEIETMPGVHYKYYDGKVSIDNIFTRTESGAHPNYGDETKIEFMATIVQLERVIERLQDDTTPDKITKLNDVLKVYNRLVYPRNVSIMVGGTSFENISMLDTLIDVIGATRKTLVDGFTVGAYSSLHRALAPQGDMMAGTPTEDLEVSNAFCTAYRAGIRIIEDNLNIDSVGSSFYPKMSTDILTGITSIIGDSPMYGEDGDVLPWIIQPAAVHTTLLRRFREICLKLAKTSSIVVTGGLKVKEPLDS